MKLFTENPDFYPTPVEVIEQMMMGENIIGKTILEPSAGSGNIVDWLKGHGAGEVIACEIDPTLRKLLDGKCPLIGEDFLKVTREQISHVHYIVMNPPYSHGAEHILHAFDIAPAGCTIISLVNDSNLHSSFYDHNVNKERLRETIELYGQSQYLGSVFDTAERRTNVSVSLIKLYKEGEGENEFANYFFSAIDEDTTNFNQTEGIMKYNLVRDLVNRYVSACKLFNETLAAADKINDIARWPEDGDYDYIPIAFGTIKKSSASGGSSSRVTHQEYKKALQKYYWRIIFNKLNMEKYATEKLRQQINRFIEQQVNVPFTMGNIYRVIDMVIQTNGQRMLSTLEEAFDLICSFSAENSTAGEKWKTNANYMVNRRFIIPHMADGYEWHYTGSSMWSMAKKRVGRPLFHLEWGNYDVKRIMDVCKALCYITGRNYDTMPSILNHSDKEEWGQWFDWGFFRVRGYKKGTMHFEFIDEDVWYKFNYEVAKMKGWALPKKKAA